LPAFFIRRLLGPRFWAFIPSTAGTLPRRGSSVPDTPKLWLALALDANRGQNGVNVGPSGFMGLRHRDLQRSDLGVGAPENVVVEFTRQGFTLSPPRQRGIRSDAAWAPVLEAGRGCLSRHTAERCDEKAKAMCRHYGAGGRGCQGEIRGRGNASVPGGWRHLPMFVVRASARS